MTFTNMESLKRHILSGSKIAVEQAQRKVWDIINEFLKQYYDEFEPELYDRTYQLLCSLVKADVRSTGNGWVAEVYFDLNQLDYSIKTLKGIGTWSNTYHRQDWTKENDAWVLNEAMTGGTHGGYRASQNTEIWTESIRRLNTEIYPALKKALIDNGIPVR